MTRSGDAGPGRAPSGAGRATPRTSAPADPLGKRALFAPPDLRSGAAGAPAGTEIDLRSGAAGAPAGTEIDLRLPASDPFTPSGRGRRAWFSEPAPSGPAVAPPEHRARAFAGDGAASPSGSPEAASPSGSPEAASPSGSPEAVPAHSARVGATIACSSCGARTSVGLIAIATRLPMSVWIPGRRWSRYLRCPACGRRAWCRVRCGG